MNFIYGEAVNVCVWLGVSDARSDTAFAFVKDHLLNLWNFDDLCVQSNASPGTDVMNSWTALLEVMKKSWFSRRWVVQEISFAREATVHCGRTSIDWRDFADAVSLFVQVEETPSKLSEWVRKDKTHPSYEHNFFEEVPFLGATLLVKTTKDLFQQSARGGHERQLTLESLVSRLGVFHTSQPRDTVYALLAMARDSDPSAKHYDDYLRIRPSHEREVLLNAARWLPTLMKERYEVNYRAQIIDVYQQFIAFAIRKAEPTRALDIICRPFARSYTKEEDYQFDESKLADLTDEEKMEKVPMPSWVPNVADLPFRMQSVQRNTENSEPGNPFGLRMERRGGDSLVGTPEQRNYNAASTRAYNKSKLRFKKRESGAHSHYSMYVEGFLLDKVAIVEEAAQLGNIPYSWLERIGWTDRTKDPPRGDRWEAFWRTLVADRDHKGGGPPIYYQRACKEVLKKAASDTTFNTNDWIQRSQTPIAGFLRRVQAVIWERCLIETKQGRLGLAKRNVRPDDDVCILYGCSVPVIMRKFHKSDADRETSQKEEDAQTKRRREKAARLLKNIFDKRLARRKGERNSAKRASTGKSKPQTSTQRALARVYELRNYARTTSLALLTMWLSRRGEALAAALTGLGAILHLISYGWSASSTSRQTSSPPKSSYLTPRATGLLAAITSVLALLHLQGQLLSRNTLLVALVLVVLFPQILPFNPRATHLKQWVELTLEHWQRRIDQSADDHFEGPWLVAAGIVLTVFRGSLFRVPQAPQPHGGSRESQDEFYYRLIGECYIHGMMDGKAIEWQYEREYEQERKSQVFEIR